MALLVITVANANPSFDTKRAEAAFCVYAVQEAMKDFGRNFESSGANASVLGLRNRGLDLYRCSNQPVGLSP